MFGGALERHVGGTADQHARAAVRRLRSDASGRTERLALPDSLPRGEHLLEHSPAGVEVHPRRRIVVLAPADGDAERQATVRDVVERRRLLGHERGVDAVGSDEDGRHEPDPLGHRRCRREGDQRLVVRIDDPVERREAREPARLRAPRPLEQLIALDARDRGGQSDGDVHPCSSTLG
jgi:hypothetical protein